MKKLIYHGLEYRILKQDENTLLKLSTPPPEVWEKFVEKNISHVNNPIQYRSSEPNDLELFDCKGRKKRYRSVITLPFLTGYKTLYDTIFPDTYTTKDILKICKNNLLILQEIHQKHVCHGDLYSVNIMINEEDDLQFIDFDALLIDDYLSPENTTFPNEKGDYFYPAVTADKEALFSLYISYLTYGNFKFLSDHLNYDALGFNKQYQEAIEEVYKNGETPIDYYYIDFIDYLISTNYESPKIYSKNIISKYGF